MKKSKLICCVLLTVSVLAGTIFAGCSDTTNYTQEIKEYQQTIESLQAENEELKAQIAGGETESDETESFETETTEIESSEQESETAESESIEETAEPENETKTAAETESDEQNVQEIESAEDNGLMESASGVMKTDEATDILVFGDSIWGNDRGKGGIAIKVEYYLELLGYDVNLYNAAVGGTRATVDAKDNEWEYTFASENSLGKMVSILNGDTDVETLQGVPSYDVMKQVIAIKDEIDLIILAYGMNDFLSQAELSNSDRPWTGYGTALEEGIKAIKRACPEADIMIIGPTYASYFPIDVHNMGAKALFNYAKVACMVGSGSDRLCMDPYNQLGIDMYNADQYLEDGIHLNEKGRELYAMALINNLLFGEFGQISGNTIEFGDLQEMVKNN